MKRVQFKVSFVLPPDATAADAKAYVADAVAIMKGSLMPDNAYGDGEPGDPMFHLDRETVRVTSIR